MQECVTLDAIDWRCVDSAACAYRIRTQAKKGNNMISLDIIAGRHYAWLLEMGYVQDTTPLEMLTLIVSEIGEAANECRSRNRVPSDRFGEELADIVLRAIGIMQHYNIPIEETIIRKMGTNAEKGNKGRTI